MKQDEIMRFAIQCHLVTTANRDGLYMDALTEFANLVAAKEREALAQPEQEPVASISYIPCCTDQTCPKCKAAAPLQRTWVGLTDEELADSMDMSIQKTCRAIEAKLKEKNT